MIKAIKLFICLILFNCNSLQAQTMLDGYFNRQGVYHLCQAAHASNDYLAGTYDINSRYIDVSLKSKDNVFGAIIHTDVWVVRGTGDLYFSDLIVKGDDDMVNPFEAFGLQATLLTSLLKAIDQDTYDKMRQAIIRNFDTDFEHWNGKMWALLAINIDYYEYLLGDR